MNNEIDNSAKKKIKKEEKKLNLIPPDLFHFSSLFLSSYRYFLNLNKPKTSFLLYYIYTTSTPLKHTSRGGSSSMKQTIIEHCS